MWGQESQEWGISKCKVWFSMSIAVHIFWRVEKYPMDLINRTRGTTLVDIDDRAALWQTLLDSGCSQPQLLLSGPMGQTSHKGTLSISFLRVWLTTGYNSMGGSMSPSQLDAASVALSKLLALNIPKAVPGVVKCSELWESITIQFIGDAWVW